MKFSHFFIDRPIFATVLCVFVIIVGGLSYFSLPIEQYPEIAPPTIQVNASYPGASAETIAATVATPLEQEINGVENMLYMLSHSTADGSLSLTITFELGTDLDTAQVLVQNRVALAEPKLPEEVRRIGVVTRKNSPNLMLVINLFSPDNSYDQTFIANYAVLQLRDRLMRIDGVGDLGIFGASEYAMRVWLDPDKIASLDLTANDVIQALRSQNVQVAGGTLNQPPIPSQYNFEMSIQTQGRLIDPAQFENIIVKSSADGRVVRLRDIGRVELGAQSYSTRGYLGKNPAVALVVFQRPGSNALATADELIRTMEEAKTSMPKGLAYDIVYNPTEFVSKSIEAVLHTILEAVVLVVIVIILFLQTWRAAIIPIVAIPVSLIGTFAVMAGLGFTLNILTLFGLILAIGIVVDDAIVVVENMERQLKAGLSAREAARKTMDEVGGALVAMGLVVVAVFLPTMFLEGITGKFYQQFGVTIAVATVISVLVSLTLSPAMAALFLRAGHEHGEDPPHNANPIIWVFWIFNYALSRFTRAYSWLTKWAVRAVFVCILAYVGLMVLAAYQFQKVPTGFIPPQDKGYFIVGVQLPPGAALERTDTVIRQAVDSLLQIDGVMNAVSFSGFSGATFTNASNAGAIFPVLEDFAEREKKGLTFDGILGEMRMRMAGIPGAFLIVIPPPPVEGVGNAGGFSMMVQDRGGLGLEALTGATWGLAMAANQGPLTTSAFTFFETSTPQIYLDIDREKAEKLGVPVSEINAALEIFLGSAYVNDFNFLGRTFRVTAQADAPFRLTPDDILRIKVRNSQGDMVPIGSVATARDQASASRVSRYNLYPAAELMGDRAPGASTGQALDAMEQLAAKVLPPGIGFEWTDLSFQEKQTGNTALLAFVLAVVFVFLLLAAQYESWTLPLAIILIVPMCLLSGIVGVGIAGMDNNVLTQIGFVVLIALASKNAILIVEFAKQLEEQGRSTWDAAVEAAHLRLRPILMTSFAFILGVLPLVVATGPGAEMRQALGIAVFSGMLGVTFFGLIFTPVFYVMTRRAVSVIMRRDKRQRHDAKAVPQAPVQSPPPPPAEGITYS
ncbi:MAG: multidrug efflux RND transporter permease subunit [Alphaproteobacteria bacterium]|nr:multidrug efflux RND transporter permease subunit [Alphaproteobacteria bacterium]